MLLVAVDGGGQGGLGGAITARILKQSGKLPQGGGPQTEWPEVQRCSVEDLRPQGAT